MVLGIIFFLIMFPLLNLVASTARAYCLRQACMEAVHRACKAQSYINDTPADMYGAGSLSANHICQNTLQQFLASGFLNHSQVVIPSTLTCIQVTTATNQAIEFNPNPGNNGVPLATVDLNNDQYFLEIRTTITAMPLVPVTLPGFPGLPGFTAPIVTQVAYRQLMEHPEGLVQ